MRMGWLAIRVENKMYYFMLFYVFFRAQKSNNNNNRQRLMSVRGLFALSFTQHFNFFVCRSIHGRFLSINMFIRPLFSHWIFRFSIFFLVRPFVSCWSAPSNAIKPYTQYKNSSASAANGYKYARSLLLSVHWMCLCVCFIDLSYIVVLSGSCVRGVCFPFSVEMRIMAQL